MTIMRHIVALLAFLAACSSSWAGYLGHSVGLTWENVPLVAVLPGEPPPTPNVTDFGGTPVGPGIEFTQAAGFDIDVSDGSIRLLASCMFCGMFGDFSQFAGFRIRAVDGNLPKIVGVSIGLDSHLGIDPWRITYDSESILINLANFSFDSGYRLVFPNSCNDAPPGFCMVMGSYEQIFQPELLLNVRFAEVPEPAPLALLGLGVTGLVLSRRRQSNQA